MFDDLIPGERRPTPGGLFDDLVPPADPGLLENIKDVGTAVVEGAKQTYRSGRAAISTYLGADQDVVEQARKSAEDQRGSQAESLKALKQDIQARKEAGDEGIVQGIKNVAGAIANNPAGGVQLVAEQAPNAAVALGSAALGAKAGAAIGTAVLPGIGTVGGAAIGGVGGFLAGLFGANTLLETGGKAIEKASDGSFTPQDRGEAIREGAVKGAVITGVDAVTLGASKYILGAAGRAVEDATVRTLADAGIDATKAATNIRAAQEAAMKSASGADQKAVTEAVEKATAEAMAKEGLLDPAVSAAVQAAQKSAFETATTLPRRLGRGAGVVGLESVGEGVGEGLGEYAATGKFSPTEAALEAVAGLSQSLPEIYVAKKLNQPGLLTEAMSRQRQIDAQNLLQQARTASDAAAAANELAGSVDDLTSAVDSYLRAPAPEPTMLDAQQRIEAAARAGQQQQDPQRQIAVDQMLRNVEERGGVAAPIEAQIFQDAGVGQPFDRIDPNLAPALSTDEKLTQATGIALAPTPRESGSESQRLAAVEQTNAESMAEFNRRVAANKAQAERQTLTLAERTSQPATAPDAGNVISAMVVPGPQRSAEQVALINQAQSRYSPQDFSILQRAAVAPFQLSTQERTRLRELREPTLPAQPISVPAQPPLMGSRVAERLGLPSNGRILTSNAKLSTRRVAPGATVSIKDGNTEHSVRVVDPSRLGNPGRMLQQVGRIFGKRLVVFESDTLRADGFVMDNDNGSIYINAKSQVNPLAVFGHELTHLVKRENAEAYAALESIVQRQLADGAMQEFEQEYGDGANVEELASDLVGNRFQEADFWTDVFNEIAAKNPQGGRAIVQRLAAALNRAINAFLKVVQQPGFQADKYVKDLNAVKAAVKDALVQYAQQQRAPATATEGAQDANQTEQGEPRVRLDGAATAESSPASVTLSRAQRGSAPDGAASENRMAVVIGAKPGEFNWNFTRSDLPPPPFSAPTQNGPRLEKIGEGTYEILRSAAFKKLAEDAFGIKGLRVAPLHGSWLNKPEPSFAIYADGLTFDQADGLSRMLGFAFAQDATVVFQPTSKESPGEIPAVYIGGAKKLTAEQMKAVLSSAQAEGIDYSSTADGKAVRFLHFGDEAGLAELMQKAARIASGAGLGAPKVVFVRSQLNESESYTKGSGDGAGQAVWFGGGEAGRSSLFRRTVDHVLVPYAKVVGSEGYRFAVSRFAQRFNLSAEQQGLIRQALLPKSGALKSTVDIASGKVKLDIKPTGARGNVSVSDIMWALQNRSAQAGLIEPGDYSDEARRLIAESIAEEVVYNINDTSSGKSAIGWYDRALKAAKDKYAAIFPEINTDRDRELLFDAVLGITSQGNDVFSNSLFAARVYQLVTRKNMTLSQAVAALKGSFGGETVAIENNILKLEELIDRNGYDAMRKFFNKKDTVSNINARLRSDSTLFYKNKPLSVDGAAEQRVTGWMVFGPKIGSFINNLHGDYSTLTADLWFSRTWNRILGFSFVHAPAREAEQYQTFMSALLAEYNYSKDREGPIQPKKITKAGKAEMPEFGTDTVELTDAEVEQMVGDPDEALRYATELEAVYRKGGYKGKSDLRRAAKNWIENRTDPVALPRTDLERDFQQRTVETAQKIIKRRTGQDITIADIQAALWYYEKDNLFKLLGGTNKKSEAADYAGAADESLKIYQAGDLFYAKTDDRYVYGNKGDYLGDAPEATLSRQRRADEVSRDELAGRKLRIPVLIEDTGQTATITLDARDALDDVDERESAMQSLLECLRK